MPSSVTHAFFALDIYDKLDKNIQEKLLSSKKYLKIFSEGPDPLYFYNLANFKRGKRIRDNYPKLIHTKNTQKFFISLIKYIKDKKLENNPEVISLLYGFISHYVLDSVMHPFIIYKTGIFNSDDLSTYKYNGLHNDMEVYIDAYLIYQRLKIFPKDFKMYKFIFEVNKYDSEIKELLNVVFKSVYDIDDFSNIYLKSIKQMEGIFKHFRYDKYGIKKVGYKFLDIFLPKKQLKKEMLSYHVHQKQKIHYLNLERNEWNHPCNQNEIYNYSFIELYRIALDKATYIIENVNDYLYKNKGVSKLEELFPNISYETGKDCDNKEICQFFEY